LTYESIFLYNGIDWLVNRCEAAGSVKSFMKTPHPPSHGAS
jgi:hypothetical protein